MNTKVIKKPCWHVLSILLAVVRQQLMAATHDAHQQASGELLSVTAAVEFAVRDNPSLAQMQARYEALAEVPSQVGTLPDPTLNLNAINFPTDTFARDQEPMTPSRGLDAVA